ncbi:3-deoxy-D-manno-octulosonic acid transferase [Rubritalea sp.]|uniref:3-deoxy-D-manno-octulosonic acid transferase n=1 Tax=Rubritalea sp. TaxID=2109375 RepID=UPI003EF62441
MSLVVRLKILRLAYNLLLPLLLAVGVGPWVIKMLKRGGFGTGLLERVGVYREDVDFEPCGVVYVHAVSVGEVLIAIKLIRVWLLEFPDDQFVLAPTTATGHGVALEAAPVGVRVIYSPVDLPFVVNRVIRRFEPKQIILIESEIWPNLLVQAKKFGAEIGVANARLSERSEKRYHKVKGIISPIFSLFDRVAVPEPRDVDRWAGLGVARSALVVTGSVKFDQQGGVAPEKNAEFQAMLDTFGCGRKVVMALSTHAGEEKLIAESLMGKDALLVIVPRHAERRSEVKDDLGKLGLEVILRSSVHVPKNVGNVCFVIDSTGELKSWTAHADVVIIGKSFLGRGGQNPAEAIAARVPIVVGPHMKNFEPLVSMLKLSDGVVSVADAQELSAAVERVLSSDNSQMTAEALKVLDAHCGATLRTVKELKV